jgi:hypothetical protein
MQKLACYLATCYKIKINIVTKFISSEHNDSFYNFGIHVKFCRQLSSLFWCINVCIILDVNTSLPVSKPYLLLHYSWNLCHALCFIHSLLVLIRIPDGDLEYALYIIESRWRQCDVIKYITCPIWVLSDVIIWNHVTVQGSCDLFLWILELCQLYCPLYRRNIYALCLIENIHLKRYYSESLNKYISYIKITITNV